MMKRNHLIAALSLTWLLASAQLVAGSGYLQQYDFPGQGDDWYGGVASPNPRQDFPRSSIETYSDGDDFGLGYEIVADPFAFGPPLDATNDSLNEYYFRFGALPVEPYTGGGGCTSNSECWDTIFCDGLEICYYGRCLPGSPPLCGDGDPCTVDYCDPMSDACAHDPITEPGEVGGLVLDRSEFVASVAVLTWYVQPPSDDYNVYRGQGTDLSDLVCFQADVTATTINDDGAVPMSSLFVYLVTGYGCGGESTLGAGTDGLERINGAPCP